MKSIESSAKTIEEAISQGLDKLGLSIGDVAIDILEQGNKGFLGLIGNRLAKVRLTVKDTGEDSDPVSSLKAKPKDETPSQRLKDKAEAAKEKVKSEQKADKPKTRNAQPKAEKKAAAPKAEPSEALLPNGEIKLWPEDTLEGKAQTFLLNVTKMMGVEVTVSVHRDEEGNIRVDMHGDTVGILIGRRGETLDALQYLTSLTVNKGQDDYTRVTLDNENYRAKREEALTRLANRMANRAVKTGRKVVMEPMNPYERRILHSALQSNDAVDTHSEGDEPNRHVVITLK